MMTANEYAPPESLAKTSIFMPKPYDFVLEALRNDSGNIKKIEVITFTENKIQYRFHCCNKELLGDESAKCECPLCLQKNKALEVTIPEVTLPREELTIPKMPVVEVAPEAKVTTPKPIVEPVAVIKDEVNTSFKPILETNGTSETPIVEAVPKTKVTSRIRKPKIILEATDSYHSVGKKMVKNGTSKKKKIVQPKDDTEKKVPKSRNPEKSTCQYCKNVYYSVSNLYRHIRRTHSDAVN